MTLVIEQGRWRAAGGCASLTACRRRHPFDGAGDRRRTVDRPVGRFAQCLREPGFRASTPSDSPASTIAPQR